MSVQRVPEKFKTADGSTFATEEEASRHSALLAAQEALGTARRDYEKALVGAGYLSADGQPYSFNRSRWFTIAHDTTGRPSLRELDLWAIYTRLSVDPTLGRLELTYTRYTNNGERLERYFLNELYASEAACLQKVVAEFKEWMGWAQASLDALVARLPEGEK